MVFREGPPQDLGYGLAKTFALAKGHDLCHHLAGIRQLIGLYVSTATA